MNAKRVTENIGPLKAPFPWFGGKSRASALIWDRFGDVPNYVEPFAGSLAVLLGRTTTPNVETVNDLDCYLANFWRALAKDPVAVAEAADWPVNEADLHARHRWLHAQPEFRERMRTEPEFYDARIAGWWVWGISSWIGDDWCRITEQNVMPNMSSSGQGIHRKLPHLSHGSKGVQQAEFRGDGTGLDARRPHLSSSQGINRNLHQQIPNVSGGGRGVHSSVHVQEKRPAIGGRGDSPNHGNGIHSLRVQSAGLLDYFEALALRLRRVRVCCGDWFRVVKPSVTVHNSLTGVMLDPPYGVSDRDKVYNHDSRNVSADVRAWAIENGSNPLLRIALCGYEGEHAMPPTWECVAWKANGGYGNQSSENPNAARERIWFSPHCLKETSLFD